MIAVENPKRGELRDGQVRYVLMRPDVLMGAAKHLCPEDGEAFLRALEESAYVHAQASFAAYKATDRFGGADFLVSSSAVASRLGWGVWTVEPSADGGVVVGVSNSPFAAGHGPSNRPVCAPISGVLRAIAQVSDGQAVAVTETACAAQGADHCIFHMTAAVGPLGEGA